MDHNGNAAAVLFFCYPCHHKLYQVYYDWGREFSFNNVNLCKSNVVQIFQFSFCDCKRYLLTYLLRKMILILFWILPISYLWVVRRQARKFDQQPSVKICFSSVPDLIKTNNYFGQHLQGDCFEKPFPFHLNNQTSLYRWVI